MGKLKTSLVAAVGIVVGVVTLRSVRKRRSKHPEEELEAVQHEDAETATEHVKAAVEHGRQAVRKARHS